MAALQGTQAKEDDRPTGAFCVRVRLAGPPAGTGRGSFAHQHQIGGTMSTTTDIEISTQGDRSPILDKSDQADLD
ncbi:hypothetical protein ElP_55600 [Tautonia plasticadhaerens]|uniref:Uncharacterized protein n=1 Tax=Tautonia plasticadhaerens TaxID=2527974 RepID=A0A518H9V3_9BACT|nr:hypothetical protein ElP_55600 [Tautonia plasticadhaerens]